MSELGKAGRLVGDNTNKGRENTNKGRGKDVLNGQSRREGVGDLVFTYDSRALNSKIPDGTYYIKFKLMQNLPSDLKFEYGEAIPWFNTTGNADQIKSSYKLSDLLEGIHYVVIEKLVYRNGSWIPVSN